MNFQNVSLFVAILSVALMAGLFYGWVISVIPGIAKIPAKSYLESMQSINREILNPGFFLFFFAAVISLPLATFFQARIDMDMKFWLILAATVIYVIGTFGVTMFGNVPMNNNLEAVDLQGLGPEQLEALRVSYEGAWNNFNLIRTLASLLSLICLILASFQNN